jgi:hypothetical protein
MTLMHEHAWDDAGKCSSPDCYGVKDVFADVRAQAQSMDRRWPDMHTEQFGPIAAGLVTRIPEFSSGEDAHNVATTRQERADQTRNEDVRRVVALLRDSHDLQAAQGQMLISLWSQAQILGLQGPTLLVGVKP